jgi:hypothetical protein
MRDAKAWVDAEISELAIGCERDAIASMVAEAQALKLP